METTNLFDNFLNGVADKFLNQTVFILFLIVLIIVLLYVVWVNIVNVERDSKDKYIEFLKLELIHQKELVQLERDSNSKILSRVGSLEDSIDKSIAKDIQDIKTFLISKNSNE